MLADLIVGHAVELDKDNAQRGTWTGQGMLCTDARTDGSGTAALSVGDFEVFESLEDAQEFYDAFVNGDGSDDTPVAADAQGYVQSLAHVKRSDLHHITQNWREFTRVQDRRVPDEPEVGRTLHVTLSVLDRTDAVVSARVECEVQVHPNDESLFNLVGSHDGVEFVRPISRVQARVLLALESPPEMHAPSSYPLAWDTPTWGTKSYNLVKKLTLSTACSDNFVDARDMLGVAQSFDGGKTAGLAALQLTKLGHPADDAIFFASTVVMHAISRTLTKPGADTRLWPDDSAAKLGAAIRAFDSGQGSDGSGPIQHALASALKAKCAVGEFDTAVLTAYRLTLPASRWAWAENSTSLYIHTGALDAFLKKGKSASDAAAIAKLDDNMSADDVHLFLSDVCAALEAQAPGTSSNVGSSLAPPPPPPFGQPGGSAAMVLWKESSKTDEHETRELSQLKIDAECCAGSTRLMAILRAFQALKDSRQDALLQGALEQCSEPAVIRLVQYNGDVAQALQGGFGPLASVCTSLRDVIERRLENLVLGEGHAYVPDRQTKAFRAARIGSLRKLRLFHLIDEEDKGSDRYPLLQFKSIDRLDTKKYQLNKVFARLEEILRISFPSQLTQLSAFMPKFRDRIEDLVVLGLPIEGTNGTSDYYRAIIDKICSPIRDLRMGDSHGELKLKFDINWLGLERDHNDRIAKGMMQHVSSGVKPGGGGKGGGGGGGGGTSGAEQTHKLKQLTDQLAKAKKQLEASKATRKGKQNRSVAVVDDDDDTDDVRPPKGKGRKRKKGGGAAGKVNAVDDLSSLDWAEVDEELEPDADGKYAKMVNAKHPLVKEWNQSHPKKGGKFSCFAYFNYVGGCPYSACKASHSE